MSKILLISDIHINSSFSEVKFLKELLRFGCDVYDYIIINGDLYDTNTSVVDYELIYLLEKFKKVVYIKGNHDFKMGDFCSNVDTFDSYELGDIYITHGHQYDWLINKKGTSGKASKYKNWFGKVTGINIKDIANFFFGWWLESHYRKSHDKAIAAHPGKRVILGHTHIPACFYKYYNSGCMVDGIITYMELVLNPNTNSYDINLIEVDT